MNYASDIIDSNYDVSIIISNIIYDILDVILTMIR